MRSFGSFSNPDGIAIDESSGDVYVADIGAEVQQTVSIEGGPTDGSFTLEFEGQKTSVLAILGGETPYANEVQSALSAPAATAVDNSKSALDPSAGDLYVMDAGNGVIDK